MLFEVYKCVQLNRCSVVCGCVLHTQCLPQGVGAPPAMLRGRTVGFPKKTGWPGLRRGGADGIGQMWVS